MSRNRAQLQRDSLQPERPVDFLSWNRARFQHDEIEQGRLQRDSLQPVDNLFTIRAGAPTPAKEAVGTPQKGEVNFEEERRIAKHPELNARMSQNTRNTQAAV